MEGIAIANLFVAKLEKAVDLVPVMPANEIQHLLRQAILRLKSSYSVSLDAHAEVELIELATSLGIDRKILIRQIVRDWLETNSHISNLQIEKDG